VIPKKRRSVDWAIGLGNRNKAFDASLVVKNLFDDDTPRSRAGTATRRRFPRVVRRCCSRRQAVIRCRPTKVGIPLLALRQGCRACARDDMRASAANTSATCAPADLSTAQRAAVPHENTRTHGAKLRLQPTPLNPEPVIRMNINSLSLSSPTAW
jgi:hypothetical protein